ncbi:hypothetical protein ACFCX4_10650, partial [Kitasatospora sp. NPDC056327]|uniref:hypothetical protein n=1 Tax=Kitasatospora sp. NPDC056327 TaxID=3345785 RepID=UPI0035DBD302
MSADQGGFGRSAPAPAPGWRGRGGDCGSRGPRVPPVPGGAAGVLTAAAVCAIFWWQGWNRPTTAAWLSSKAAVKVG